jgi:hypothetical protein
MNAHEIKALGKIWGHQDGLLSAGELELLMQIVAAEPRPLAALEVGHFMGLSTCGLVHALWQRGGSLVRANADGYWTLTTVDHHQGDAWVPWTPAEIFEQNMFEHFADARVEVSYRPSQTLTAPLPFDFVFYDGDHGEEQERFTVAVIESPRVRTLVFDDRDFPVPMRCSELLMRHGWIDESPDMLRAPGDKGGAETMTLAVFRRPT